MAAAVVQLPPFTHSHYLDPGYYINRTHPVIVQSDNNNVETCLKPAE